MWHMPVSGTNHGSLSYCVIYRSAAEFKLHACELWLTVYVGLATRDYAAKGPCKTPAMFP